MKDLVVLIQYTESHKNLTYQIPSQIHLILPHTKYKPLRLIETIQNILKFTQKIGVLREKQKEIFGSANASKFCVFFPKKAAWPTILQTAMKSDQMDEFEVHTIFDLVFSQEIILVPLL